MKRTLLCILSMALLLSACGNHADSQNKPDTPTWQEQYDLGVRYLSEGNYEEAIIAFTAAIEIDPKQALAYIGRGGAYVQSGETKKNLAVAQEDYEMAIKLDETNVDAYLGLADVHIRLGSFDVAEEILQRALEKTGGNQTILNKLDEFSSETITDSLGRPRKTIWRNPDGTISSFSIITQYNSDGNAARVDYYNADAQLTDYEIDTYTAEGYREDRYNADGTLMFSAVQTELKDDSEFYSRVEDYDANGKLTSYSLYGREKTQHFQPDGTMSGYEVYKYNENGQMTEWLRYNQNGELWEYYVTEYDADGNRSMYTHYDADGTVLNYIDYRENKG